MFTVTYYANQTQRSEVLTFHSLKEAQKFVAWLATNTWASNPIAWLGEAGGMRAQA